MSQQTTSMFRSEYLTDELAYNKMSMFMANKNLFTLFPSTLFLCLSLLFDFKIFKIIFVLFILHAIITYFIARRKTKNAWNKIIDTYKSDQLTTVSELFDDRIEYSVKTDSCESKKVTFDYSSVRRIWKSGNLVLVIVKPEKQPYTIPFCIDQVDQNALIQFIKNKRRNKV